jgi:hypothetical protein
MRHLLILTTAFFATAATAQAGTPSLSEVIPAYSRDAQGIAMAVTEVLPSIENCVTAHQALGGAPSVSFDIAFDVSTDGEVALLTIDSDKLPATGLDSCIEGTLSAMRFVPGTQAVPVSMPLTASVTTETTVF